MDRSHLMRPGRRRALTAGERALAWEMFGAELDAARVRLFAIPWWTRAFVPGAGLIVWPAATALADFGAAVAPLAVQAVFVHELTHVWQAQNGVNLLTAKIAAGDHACAYTYELTDGCAFADRNIEQQAMIVQHAFLASRGGAAPYPVTLYASVLASRRIA